MFFLEQWVHTHWPAVRRLPSVRLQIAPGLGCGEEGQSMSVKSCSSCANVMESETSGTRLRCGWAYFKLSPKARKMPRLDVFEPVEATACCGNYREPGPQRLLFAVNADGLLGRRA